MDRGREQQASIMADYGLLRVKGFGEWNFQRQNIPGRVCKYRGLDSLKILLVYTKKSFMEESGNEPEKCFCYLRLITSFSLRYACTQTSYHGDNHE